MVCGSDDARALTRRDRERLAAIRSADGLSDLVTLTGAASVHDAYFRAKREWYDLRARELASADETVDGLPGNCVAIDSQAFHVHGVTHADTAAERTFLREHVASSIDDDAVVYCEQGIRSMYFDDVAAVCGMDDYSWAMAECEALAERSHVSDLVEPGFSGIGEDIDALAARFREAAFSLIDAGSDVYGERFSAALGDVASVLLTSHEDLATGDEFEAFTKTKRASRDPSALVDLQRYYEKRFLPQAIEREWLRRHDPELELVTHARNERMADYAVYHAEDAPTVRLIVGAAHQPGLTEYLEQYREGERTLEGFEPFE